MGRSTPLVLVAGFLGAGKTTLLRRMLPRLRAEGVVPHVILNDYRNAGIDAATLEGDADLVTPIAGTCICCGSQQELMTALRGAPLTSTSVMLLEANGTADTTEIIELLTVDRRVGGYTRPLQVTVVDATRWGMRGRHDTLERLQARTARYLLPTRLDELGADRRAEVLDSLAGVAPRGVAVDVAEVTRAIIELRSAAADLRPRRFHRPGEGEEPRNEDHHARHHFSSVEIPIPEPVEEGAFRAVLGGLPEEVVRVKGITRLEGATWPVYFERTDSAGSVALFPIRQTGAFDSVAVLIGVGLDGEGLEATFQSLW